jgi:hypothetical protein
VNRCCFLQYLDSNNNTQKVCVSSGNQGERAFIQKKSQLESSLSNKYLDTKNLTVTCSSGNLPSTKDCGASDKPESVNDCVDNNNLCCYAKTKSNAGTSGAVCLKGGNGKLDFNYEGENLLNFSYDGDFQCPSLQLKNRIVGIIIVLPFHH